jgi:hypothetical protein
MCLYFMHQRIIGEASWLHSSIVTATPPDLPLGWSDDEINFLQDRLTIDLVHRMKAYLHGLFDRVYPKLVPSIELFFDGVPKSTKEAREFFIEAYTSVSTRYI